MINNKKILAVIPARGGSKSIPRKNIKLLAGKPLIAYTIEAANQSKYLTRCIVSTEDKEIAEIARQYGADVPFMRPKKLAQDDSTSEEVDQHALNWLKKHDNEEYDYLMRLLPTTPLRLSQDIDECIKKIIKTNSDSVMSMFKLTDFSAKKLKRIENDLILPWLEEEDRPPSRRQNLENVYKRNCAVYLTKIKFVMKGDIFGKISRPYIMPPERSIDINEPVDFELAEFWLNKLKRK